MLSPRYGTIPCGDQLATWWQIDYIRPLPSREGQQFIFIGIEIYSGNKFVFSAHRNSASTNIQKLREYLILRYGILSSMASNQSTLFTGNKVKEWAHDIRIYCHVYTIPSRSCQPQRALEWLLKAQMKLQYFEAIICKNGGGTILQDLVYALNQRLVMWYYVPKKEYMGPRNKGQKQEWPRLQSFKGPSAGHCSSCSFRVGSTGLQSGWTLAVL